MTNGEQTATTPTSEAGPQVESHGTGIPHLDEQIREASAERDEKLARVDRKAAQYNAARQRSEELDAEVESLGREYRAKIEEQIAANEYTEECLMNYLQEQQAHGIAAIRLEGKANKLRQLGNIQNTLGSL